MPVIDAHEHLIGYSECQSQCEVMPFILVNYICTVVNDIDNKLYEFLTNINIPDKERYVRFCEVWKLVKNTGYGKVIQYTLKCLGIKSDLTPEDYEVIYQELNNRSIDRIKVLYQDNGIAKSITHVVGHGNWDGIKSISKFLNNDLCFDKDFYPILGIAPFTWLSSIDNIQKIALLSNTEIKSFNDLINSIDIIVDKCIQKGVIGFKNDDAYSRGLLYENASFRDAENVFNKIISDNQVDNQADKSAFVLSNYLVRHFIEKSIDYQIPFAIHTGFLYSSESPKSNAVLLRNLFCEYPNAKFDLYHLNYPRFDDLLSIMKSHKNITANCCWTTSVDPEYTSLFLRHAVTSLPANRVIGFGGDYVLFPELALGHLELARNVMTDALSKLIDSKYLNINDAEYFAKLWSYDNAATVYRL